MSAEVIHPGDEGLKLVGLHQLLLERGVLPPDAEQEIRAHRYGPITEGAVRTFQAQHGLAVDAIVGPRTFAALHEAPAEDITAVPPPDLKNAPHMPARALRIADQEWRAVVREEPSGSNRGPRVDDYLGADALCYRRYVGRKSECLHCAKLPGPTGSCRGAPWCGAFARWCFETAAMQLGEESHVRGWGDLASAWKWKDAAIARGRFVDEPAPGRVGVIIVPRVALEPPQGHVVLVANVDGDHVFTREGNRGNRVAAARRAIAEFVGFVDIG